MTPPYPITVDAPSLSEAFATASEQARRWAQKNDYPDFFLSLKDVGMEARQGRYRSGGLITFYFHVEPREA